MAWERAALPATARARVVNVRTGIVLSAKGGALPRLALPFRFFLGGPIGSGEQWQPVVHIKDELALLMMALDDERVEGPLNAVGPKPLKNRDLALALGRVLGRPSAISTPEIALRAALGESAVVVLASQRALPQKAEKLGFKFRFPEAEMALKDLLEHTR